MFQFESSRSLYIYSGTLERIFTGTCNKIFPYGFNVIDGLCEEIGDI